MKNLFVLLVAIDEYHDVRYNLEGCVNDLLEVKLFLERFYDNDEIRLHIKEVRNAEATRQNVIAGFSHFDQADEKDLCFILLFRAWLTNTGLQNRFGIWNRTECYSRLYAMTAGLWGEGIY